MVEQTQEIQLAAMRSALRSQWMPFRQLMLGTEVHHMLQCGNVLASTVYLCICGAVIETQNTVAD